MLTNKLEPRPVGWETVSRESEMLDCQSRNSSRQTYARIKEDAVAEKGEGDGGTNDDD